MILKKALVIYSLLLFSSHGIIAQNDQTEKPTDSLSKFDRFNKKAEALFKIIPVPIVSYSSEAGNIFGLAKFNAFHPVKNDTLSKPSKISELVTFSSKGRINVVVANDLILKENKYILISFFNYKEVPEYIFGIGNDVSIDDVEEISTQQIRFKTNPMVRIYENLYLGGIVDIADYIKVETDSTSFLVENQVTGLNGGTNFGLGLSLDFDSRENRYNPSNGAFASAQLIFNEKALGSAYQYSRFELDLRKYFNPWLEHVIAVQATTTALGGDAPFYNLALLGGANKMRGYYEGALRDKILVDTQLEYRMPVWNIFGVVGWVGTGRVAPAYKKLSFEDFWPSYGGGLRIQVDSKNKVNLRLDFGFGRDGIHGTYISFAEAF
ncbi:BamA/TamA family outer membrane protein [Aequorivita sp. SDUM287046]|uniref:BamA/TamA family outer membrane protein n=1 Tax=Aequorivita aurantiaca TaxID=3053356 RepID=A0ABT8DKJ3_9FLAO|nr:BamA/TamA family outer membrane protein [Aequorivita aurantiaca]MDN3723562.1 BamA/TamA family outer membrane protein [Aequorivita aurantiaca]